MSKKSWYVPTATMKDTDRKTGKGRICTGCNEDRELSEYYQKASRCKYCYKKAYDKRQNKKVKLW